MLGYMINKIVICKSLLVMHIVALATVSQLVYFHIEYTCSFLKFPRVKAQISSFERVPIEMGKISQLNLGKHDINVNNFSQICDPY